jgi:hypothetical protein
MTVLFLLAWLCVELFLRSILTARWTLRLGSGGSPLVWRDRATISNSPATTSEAGEPPSTQAGWNTHQRVRRAPLGSGRRGTRRSERRAHDGRRPITRPARLSRACQRRRCMRGRCSGDKNVTPDLGSGGRPFPSRPLATTRDIADESGLLVPALPQDRRGGTDEDQQFSCRMEHIGSRNVYTAALVCWNRRRRAAE